MWYAQIRYRTFPIPVAIPRWKKINTCSIMRRTIDYKKPLSDRMVEALEFMSTEWRKRHSLSLQSYFKVSPTQRRYIERLGGDDLVFRLILSGNGFSMIPLIAVENESERLDILEACRKSGFYVVVILADGHEDKYTLAKAIFNLLRSFFRFLKNQLKNKPFVKRTKHKRARSMFRQHFGERGFRQRNFAH